MKTSSQEIRREGKQVAEMKIEVNRHKTVKKIPENVEQLREILLDYERTIPWASKVRHIFTEELDKQTNISIPPTQAYWGTYTSSTPNPQEKARIKRQEKEISADQVEAMKFRGFKLESERKWVHPLLVHVFKEYQQSPPTETQQKHEAIFDKWQIAEELPWTETRNFENGQRTTMPTPDITYGFPIFTRKKLEDAGVPKGYVDSSSIANFSFDFLKKLREHDLITSPATSLLNVLNGTEKVSKVRENHLICFPWAVVEFKRDGANQTDIDKCYCQAANAAAAALALQETLAQKLYVSVTCDLFPVIAFTCIGSKIKTWLAYSKYGSGTPIRKMVCISDSAITSTWGMYSIRLTIRNMHEWVSRILRPKLVQLLDDLRKQESYTQLKSTSPTLSVWAKSSSAKNRRRRTDEVQPVHEMDGRNWSRGLQSLKSPNAARKLTRSISISTEPRCGGLSISDNEGQVNYCSEAQDSGVEVLSDDDVVQLRRNSIASDGKIAAKEIEKILDDRKRVRKGGRNWMTQYLVKYKSLDESHNEWVFSRTVGRNSRIVEEYWNSLVRT